MKFSLVVPVYNTQREFLIKGMDSIVRELFPYASLKDESLRCECVLVNDKSDSETWDVIQNYIEMYPETFKLISLSQNHGNCFSRNMGIRAASGDYISFMDCDDFLSHGYINNVFYSLKHYRKYPVIHYNYFRTVEKEGGRWRPYVKEGDMCSVESECSWKEKCHGHNMVWTYIIKRDTLLSHRIEFPEKLERERLSSLGERYLGEDNYFTMMLFNYAGKVKNVLWFGVYHRIHSMSLGSTSGHVGKNTGGKDCIKELKKRGEYYLGE